MGWTSQRRLLIGCSPTRTLFKRRSYLPAETQLQPKPRRVMPGVKLVSFLDESARRPLGWENWFRNYSWTCVYHQNCAKKLPSVYKYKITHCPRTLSSLARSVSRKPLLHVPGLHSKHKKCGFIYTILHCSFNHSCLHDVTNSTSRNTQSVMNTKLKKSFFQCFLKGSG